MTTLEHTGKRDDGAYRTTSLNTDRLTALISDKLGWNEGKIEGAIAEYTDFLEEHKDNSERSFSPTPEVDEVWHLHILDTKEYMRFCNAYFGYYLHHTPEVGDTDHDPIRARCNGDGGCWSRDPQDEKPKRPR